VFVGWIYGYLHPTLNNVAKSLGREPRCRAILATGFFIGLARMNEGGLLGCWY
jgi:hypothetical protein